jgi:hypothetical protein
MSHHDLRAIRYITGPVCGTVVQVQVQGQVQHDLIKMTFVQTPVTQPPITIACVQSTSMNAWNGEHYRTS